MSEQWMPADQPTAIETTTSGQAARSWWWFFLLLSLWVYGIRTGCTFLIVLGGLEAIYEPLGIFLYPVQILGVALIPALLQRFGVLANLRAEKRVSTGLLALSVILLTGFVFVRGLLLQLALFYLLVLCPSVAMGIALRRGALYWREEKVALIIGLAFLLHNVYGVGEMLFYSFPYALSMEMYVGLFYLIFIGLLLAAMVLRLRMRDEAPPALPPATHEYPRWFSKGILCLIMVHSLFSTAINTVIYFENMDDFHTFSYELFFHMFALLVILAAVLLFHHRKWLAPAVVGLLLICFGQGLSLFGIQSKTLAIAYNLITMTGKMPPFVLSLILPVFYAVGMRKPKWACLGFAITSGADFLLMLTQLTEKGISGVLPGQTRQGVLLLIGLCLIGALFYLYNRFEQTNAKTLLKAIQDGRQERKGTRETVDGLDLTSREKEVTMLLLAGDSQKMIAAKLSVSPSTVSFHIRNLYRKLKIQSKAELFALFLSDGPPDAA